MSSRIKCLKENPSQTAGPYVHIGCMPSFSGIQGMYVHDLGTRPNGQTEKAEITIRGHIFDGSNSLINDAMIEFCYLTKGDDTDIILTHWGRIACDLQTGEFVISAHMPVALDGVSSPHISLWIVARGINLGLHTRVYFEDAINKKDKLFALLSIERQDTLIAKRQGNEYRFEINLQGEQETVFFDF
ncbi:MAG: protocatechuate 3,4-dioxygenase subunit alpha [Pseudomonadota bacterium]